MRIILTDVTYMSGTHVCIAGWDTAQQQLVRPLLPQQQWTTAHIGPNGFQTGSVVNFEAANIQPTGNFPHLTEDFVVTEKFTITNTLNHAQLHAEIAASLTNNLDQYFMFNNSMRAKRHTPDRTQAPSLGGIIVHGDQIKFYETSWNTKRKLRCRFTIPGQQPYDFPVTSVDLRDAWRQEGLQALSDLAAGSMQLHLRTGLARAWSPAGGPLVCYCQLNNLLSI